MTGLDGRKTTPNRCGTRAHCLREIAGKGIIPAGVKKQDVGSALTLHDPLYVFEAKQFQLKRRQSQQLGIGGYDVVLPRHLQAMPRVEKQTHLGAA